MKLDARRVTATRVCSVFFFRLLHHHHLLPPSPQMFFIFGEEILFILFNYVSRCNAFKNSAILLISRFSSKEIPIASIQQPPPCQHISRWRRGWWAAWSHSNWWWQLYLAGHDRTAEMVRILRNSLFLCYSPIRIKSSSMVGSTFPSKSSRLLPLFSPKVRVFSSLPSSSWSTYPTASFFFSIRTW